MLVQFAGRGQGYLLAVAEDQDPVADLRDLVELVRDEDDGHALGGQVPDPGEEQGDFRLGQDGGRFVQDQYLGIVDQGLGDLDHLLLGHAQGADQGVRANVRIQLGQELGRPGPHGLFGQQRSLGQLGPEEDVFEDGHLADQVEFLGHGGDAQPLGRQGGFDIDPVAAQMEGAGGELIDAADDFDQG